MRGLLFRTIEDPREVRHEDGPFRLKNESSERLPGIRHPAPLNASAGYERATQTWLRMPAREANMATLLFERPARVPDR